MKTLRDIAYDIHDHPITVMVFVLAIGVVLGFVGVLR